MNRELIDRLFYKEADYVNSALYSVRETDIHSKIIFAKSLLFLGRLDEAYFEFRKLNMHYEAGYCQLLKGYLYLAEKIWNSASHDAFDISWGLSLISILNSSRIKYPMYFQIRCFLEQDINMFYFVHHSDYVEKLLKNAGIFAQINPESYKFFARVLFHNEKFELANEFLKLSLDVCYKDPETHFLIAQIHLINKDITAAQRSLKTAIDVSGGYFPAEKLLSDLK